MTNNPSPCIFCKIAAGEIPATIVYQDESVTAFRDIQPSAPTHILIIPNKHIASVNEAETDDAALLGKLILTAKELAIKENIAESGYRLITNTGPNGGQTVFHIHLHLLGGAPMKHPMG